MDIEQLKQEIKKTGMKDRYIHIGTSPCCDDCFNLIKRQDGKWEIFYGERGQKVNLRVYITEEEATDVFLKLIQKNTAPYVARYPLFSLWKKKTTNRKD